MYGASAYASVEYAGMRGGIITSVSVSDTLTVTDSLQPFTIGALITETVAVAESFKASIERLFSDTLSVTDSFKASVSVTFSETISVIESLLFSITAKIAESMSVSDSFKAYVTALLQDTITVTDSFVSRVIRIGNNFIARIKNSSSFRSGIKSFRLGGGIKSSQSRSSVKDEI
jgi:hypothetical protein